MTALIDMTYSFGTEEFKNTAGLCWILLQVSSMEWRICMDI